MLEYITINHHRFYKTPYRNLYISRSGDVVSDFNGKGLFKERTPLIDHDGYAFTGVWAKNKKGKEVRRNRYIHRIMAETFLGKRPKGFVVDHRNHNKLDNSIKNLRYIEAIDNIVRSHLNIRPKLKIECKLILNRNHYIFSSIRKMVEFLGLTRRHYDRIKSKLYKQVAGYEIISFEEVDSNRIILKLNHVSND